ncbi:unnamed protein product, partial [Linum tenue]
SILEAEVRAIRDGLSLLWSLGFRNVEVESDSQLAVHLIRSEKDLFHPLEALIADCRALLRQPWTTKFSHILREANAVADLMAALGHSCRDGEHLWPNPPPQVIPLLELDSIGHSFPRP